jgi:cytidylate kinase
MYRVVTLAAFRARLTMDQTEKIAELAKRIKIGFQPGEPEQRVFLNDDEVTQDIRTAQIDNNVSAVAAIPAVRAEMTNQQRQIAANGGIVMDGRDIGTTVLPNAPVKIFMVATAHERARRRYVENKAKGIATASLEDLQKEIELRDQKDSTRKVSPLTQAPDAIRLDTTKLSIDEVVDAISEIIEKTQEQL